MRESLLFTSWRSPESFRLNSVICSVLNVTGSIGKDMTESSGYAGKNQVPFLAGVKQLPAFTTGT